MFQCDKCGLCCKSIGKIEIFAEMDRGDGICKYLDEKTNLCKIYDKRPLLCNLDKSYDYYFSSCMSREEYYAINYAACQELKSKGKIE